MEGGVGWGYVSIFKRRVGGGARILPQGVCDMKLFTIGGGGICACFATAHRNILCLPCYGRTLYILASCYCSAGYSASISCGSEGDGRWVVKDLSSNGGGGIKGMLHADIHKHTLRAVLYIVYVLRGSVFMYV